MVLDRVPTRQAVIARLEAAAEQAPRLRWRLDDPTGTHVRPGWVENPEFSAARHLRTMALGSPGDRSQLLELIALLEPSPFDPDRGPWDVTLIEGLEGGRAALYLRAHHVLTDGLGGLSLIGLLVDEAIPPPPVVEAPAAEPFAAEAAEEVEAETPSKRKPGTVSINIDLTSAAAPVAQGVAAGVSFARTINPLELFVRSVQWGLDMASSVSHQVVVTGGRLSPIPPSGAMTSRFDVLTIPDARGRGPRTRRQPQRSACRGRECGSRPLPREGRPALLRASARPPHDAAPRERRLRRQLGCADAVGGADLGRAPRAALRHRCRAPRERAPRTRDEDRGERRLSRRPAPHSCAHARAPRTGQLRRLRRDGGAGIPHRAPRGWCAHRGVLPLRPEVGLPREHQRLRQRRPPRHRHRGRPQRDPRLAAARRVPRHRVQGVCTGSRVRDRERRRTTTRPSS